MIAIASQITNVSSVYSTDCSHAYQWKYQSSASLAFVRGIHRWPMNSHYKGPVTRKMFPFDDVIGCPWNTTLVENYDDEINNDNNKNNGALCIASQSLLVFNRHSNSIHCTLLWKQNGDHIICLAIIAKKSVYVKNQGMFEIGIVFLLDLRGA